MESLSSTGTVYTMMPRSRDNIGGAEAHEVEHRFVVAVVGEPDEVDVIDIAAGAGTVVYVTVNVDTLLLLLLLLLLSGGAWWT